MNQHLSNIELFIQQSALTIEEKQKLLKEILNADKQWNILEFKLDRTEKVKKTTGVLLEETIEELEKKRKAVEAQNRELEIEAALERVRSRTSAMRSSEDLHDVINEVNNQLRQLNFQFDGTDFMTDYSDKGYNIWLANFPSPFYVPAIDHKLVRLLKEVIQRGDNFFTFVLTTEEKNEYFKNIFENTIAKNTPEEVKQYVYSTKGMATSCVVLKNIKLSVTNFASVPFTDIENEILKRFAYVFEQSYTRFLDLQKAEAQAREAEIELGLERVRARAMAMHGSDELKELVKTLFEELIRLDVKLATCLISTFDISTLDERSWMFHPVTREPYFMRVPYNEQPFYHEMLQAWKERNAAWNYCLEGETKVKWHDFLFADTEFALLPQSVIDDMRGPDKVFFTASYYSYGAIQAASLEPFPPQSIDIIQRFSKVFDLSYTRFLDLQKAEAQAREAQVELGLERVRARAMAMHKSDELQDVVNAVFERLKALNIDMNVASIFIFKDGSKDWEQWVASADTNYSNYFHLSYTDNAIFNDLEEAKQKGKDFYTVTYSYEQKNDWFNYAFLNTEYSRIPTDRKKFLIESPLYHVAFALTKHAGLQLCKYSGAEFSEGEHGIMNRFSKVFEQAYVRFLDLQKAEAQARESDIELSLERVRAKTMAMQKPSEFVDVISVIGEQFVNLGFDIEWVNFGADGFNITAGIDIWNFAVIPGGSPVAGRMFIPYFDHPVFAISAKSINEYLNGGKDFFIMTLDKHLKDSWLDHMYAQTIFKDVPHELREIQYDKPGYTSSNIALKETWLSIGKFDINPFSDEQHAIQRRLANAFGQAYTRFLDLQKAEAQAKESQIQLALERVRARTMAMQKSDELPEAANLLFQQIQSLGMPAWSAGYCIWNEDKKGITLWMSSEGVLQPPFKAPLTEDPSFIHMREAHERGETFFVEEAGGEELVKHYQYMRTLPVVGEILDSIIEAGHPLPTFQIFHLAYFSQGFLLFITYESVPEAHDIFKRFGKVFEQTYTRFLDLQKAEAQARESQIQLALERTRTQSMLMQHSKELDDTLRVFHEQILLLGINSAFSFLWLPDEEKGRHIFWAAWAENNSKFFKSKAIDYPLDRNEPATAQCLIDWKSSEPVISYHVPPAGVESYFAAWQELFAGVEQLKPEHFQGGLNYVEAFMKYGCFGAMVENELPKDEKKILLRFAIEFERTYTRFLDLKKAEAQAREAQIELALERVRARTMAMHKSEELIEIMAVMFDQLAQLQLRTDAITLSLDYKKNLLNLWMAIPGQTYPAELKIPYINIPFVNSTMEAVKNGTDFYSTICDFKEKNRWIQHLFEHTIVKNTPDDRKQFLLQAPGIALSLAMGKNIALLVANYAAIPFADEENGIIKRFAKVFEQSYTRFLDLQKAEAQAREAQIEAALEKVRSRSLAMHKSDELQEVVNIVSDKMQELGVVLDGSVTIKMISEGSKDFIHWSAAPHLLSSATRYEVPYFDHPIFTDFWAAKENGLDFFAKAYPFEIKNTFFEQLFEHSDYRNIPDEVKKLVLENDSYAWSIAFYKHSGIYIDSISGKLLSEQGIEILKRFARVFEQAYIRFLDLQKAEAQARESQIEAALEKVRSRSLAMHAAGELGEVVTVIVEKLKDLGVVLDANGVVLCTYFQHSKDVMHWIVSPDYSMAGSYLLPYFNHPIFNAAWQSKENGDEYFSQAFSVAEKNSFFEYAFEHSDYRNLPDEFKQWIFQHDKHILSFAWQKNSAILIPSHTGVLPSEEDIVILKRFAKVFEQSYVRFLDLQKAEAQAREAQVEASLERVRSKTMAMHNSNDVGETVATMFAEFVHLGIYTNRCGILIFNDPNVAEVWTARSTPEGDAKLIIGNLDLDAHKMLRSVYNAWKAKETFYQYNLIDDDLKNYYNAINNSKFYPTLFDLNALPVKEFHSDFFFNDGAVFSFTNEPVEEAYTKIIKRFALVFGQTYRRYLDLQKAEANAREAQIEAALEKVRGKAMAMHNSADLSSTASVVFTELRRLGINPIRCGVGLLNKESRNAQLYAATSSADGDSLALIGWVELSGHPVLKKIYDTWIRNEEYYPELTGRQLKSYYELLLKGLSVNVPEWQGGQKQYGTFLPFTIGCLYAWSEAPYNEAEIKILKRFSNIIDLTFRRYIDLKKSEASAKEAIKQAALDRIRADIASMRSISDLDRITPLIWNELTILGINFIRCGVFIMDDAQQLIHTFLSTPDGKAIAALHLPYATPGNIQKVIDHWHQNKNYIDHWYESDFTQFAEMLVQQKALLAAAEYLKTIPHDGFYLHFLPFLQGMLYVGNTTQLNDEEIKLIQSVADAFSTAYARYEDFNKLEAAKRQVEKTLVDLKQAQQQLVQAEKMASLGELTAGIAHEIQNPLNFVNNFSEVNDELIEELQGERRKAEGERDETLADEIINDIKQNLAKINHHGKRADAIVKGMLQHSRKSEGKKEPTNINALCDEYLRLSFHGLRAKDKSFNADFKTDLDETIGKINIVPQDIGRVLLNLYNNAFYATNEKFAAHRSPLTDNYKPLVSVQTKKLNDKVEIIVSDNGNGIPSSIKEKIFQPFFTTKPTGQGTGLGLSLSYDIIKAHGGEIKVESKEGEGTIFIIQLPVG